MNKADAADKEMIELVSLSLFSKLQLVRKNTFSRYICYLNDDYSTFCLFYDNKNYRKGE